MFVKELRIAGIKGFEPGAREVSVSLERPDGTYAGWTVLAGRNGAGKSTVLQAIALAVAGPASARSLRLSFQGWINENVQDASAAVKLRYNPEVDRFGEGGFPPSDFWAGLTWTRDPDGQASSKSVEPLIEQYLPTKSGAKKSALRGPWFENPRGWFVAGYGPFRRLSKASSDAQRLMLGTTRLVQLATLFREDASLEECVRWLQQINFQKLENKAGAAELEAGVIELLNDGLLPDGVRVDRVDSQGLWISGVQVAPLPLEEMSDGYRTVAALVADMCRQVFASFGELRVDRVDGHVRVPYEGVVLIDEIDVHLHVSWQQRIGFWLKEHFPNIQFIVSTHSPFICQAADEAGLIRLPAPGELRNAEVITGRLFNRIVNGGADDATLSELFGLEYTHSYQSELLRHRAAELEAKAMVGKVDADEQLELLDILDRLPQPDASLIERVGAELRSA